METISKRILDLIKKENYANPFSQEFDLHILKTNFGEDINKSEQHLCHFLVDCNYLNRKLTERIFELFNKFQLSPDDIREYCFISINKQFLEMRPHFFDHFKEGHSIEPEKTPFATFKHKSGQELSSQFALELSGDILSIVIDLTKKWNPPSRNYIELKNLDWELVIPTFNELWYCCNLLFNLESTAYPIIKHENGIVDLNSNGDYKLISGDVEITALQKAGLIRASNNTTELLIPQMALFSKLKRNSLGIKKTVTHKNTITASIGRVDIMTSARANIAVHLFQPHFTEFKLSQFDGLNIVQLSELLVYIEQCIQFELNKSKPNRHIRAELVPIKFQETDLIRTLSRLGSIEESTVRKFLESITSKNEKPYFWRDPFWKSNKYLYFSLAGLAGPNHLLFLDKWINSEGLTITQKEELYTKLIQDELAATKHHGYKFDIGNLTELSITHDEFQNNILIETATKMILLEIKLYDLPVEPVEVDTTLNYLGLASLDLHRKAGQILNNFDGTKELIKIIVTNYTNFSGLSINGIPICDFTLFKNYIEVGNIRKVAISFQEQIPFQSNNGILKYYNNEVEFNNNFLGFFLRPIPVYNIVERFMIKEISITPEFLNPKFLVDIIEHIPDDQHIQNRLSHLSTLLNLEYYGDPEDSAKEALDQKILYSLKEIFTGLAVAPYESTQNRISLYHKIAKTKLLGFAHLAYYILNTLENFTWKTIKSDNHFTSVKYDIDEILKLIEVRKLFDGRAIRISEYRIEDGILTQHEEKQIVSFAIGMLSGLRPKNIGKDVYETSVLCLMLLNGLSHKYDVELEFYSACSNVIDSLNFIHKYQPARDFAEEILVLSIKQAKPAHGWNILFKCFTHQQSVFDASIYGCLFLSAMALSPITTNYLALESFYGAIKYFRNFGLDRFSKLAFDNLARFKVSEYDLQKFTLSYFNSFLTRGNHKNPDLFLEVAQYLAKNIEKIIMFKDLGIVPWLAYLYNVTRIEKHYGVTFNLETRKYISVFEQNLDKSNLDSIRWKILGETADPKQDFIDAIVNTFETRSVSDFVHESRLLTIITNKLLEISITNSDTEGLLLTGLILNDQTLSFSETEIERGAVTPISKTENSLLRSRLTDYRNFVLGKIELQPQQMLLWIFEDGEHVYSMKISNSGVITFQRILNWNLPRMKLFIKNLHNFYFNARKDANGKPKCEFSNPRGERDYNDIVQQEDYNNLINELSYSKLNKEKDITEILIYSSIEMSSFPHNLIRYEDDFIGATKSICNVISLERFLDNHNKIELSNNLKLSAWIPIEDQEQTINWGHSILLPVLEKYSVDIHTGTYPRYPFTTDINIFLAHGVMDGAGFKAVYTNHEDKIAITYPYSVFGNGQIAILFICNSGSSRDALFANSLSSFSSELLKSGYKTVIAPFWSFDVTMAGIWLNEFLLQFYLGEPVTKCAHLANKKLMRYDTESSNLFKAPAGSLAMHVYGNPNLQMEQTKPDK